MLLNKDIYINNISINNAYIIKFTMFLKSIHLSVGNTTNFYRTCHE